MLKIYYLPNRSTVLSDNYTKSYKYYMFTKSISIFFLISYRIVQIHSFFYSRKILIATTIKNVLQLDKLLP